MTNELMAKLAKWHERSSYRNIVNAIEAIPQDERDYELVSHLARALNNLEQYEQALEQLMAIAEEGKSDWLWHFRTGYSFYYLERYREAVGSFEQADRLNPGDGTTRMLLSMSRQGIGESREETVPAAEVSFDRLDFSSFWEDSDYAREEYVSDPPTDELIGSVERELGYKLPTDYIRLMKMQNGGIPVNTCFPTDEGTSWAEDHIAITGIMGIGRDKTYSLCGELGSRFMIEEWGYPDIGVVLCDCPSAGHDVVMLDYRACGKDGEPAVIHVDQEDDYKITVLAGSFGAFIAGLVNEDVYDTSAADKEDAMLTVSQGAFSSLLAELCGNASEVDDIESMLRAVCARIVEEKGYFALHADELSTLMYDAQFWLYARSYPDPSRQDYLDAYKEMIAFGGGGFSTGGYAPGFVTDWLEDRIGRGMIQETDGTLRFAAEAEANLLARLRSAAEHDGNDGIDGEDGEDGEDGVDGEDGDELEPFRLVEQAGGGMSVILVVGSYKRELFLEREEEGFEGNGYDWSSLAAVFLNEKLPELAGIVRFDPEADMFCAYSGNGEALRRFARLFKEACEDEALIRDLFSRAELD